MYKRELELRRKDQLDKIAKASTAEAEVIYSKTQPAIEELQAKQNTYEYELKYPTTSKEVKAFNKQQDELLDEEVAVRSLAYDLKKTGQTGNDTTGMTEARLRIRKLKETEKKYGKDSSEFSAEALKTLIHGGK